MMRVWHSVAAGVVRGLAVGAVCSIGVAPALAEGLVRGLEMSEDGGCQQLHIRLSEAVNFVGQAPHGTGTVISIPVEQVDGGHAAGDEAVEVPTVPGLVGAKLVREDGGAESLAITFQSDMRYALVMEAETRHIRIDVAKADAPSGCVAAATKPVVADAAETSPTTDDAETPGDVVSALRPAVVDDAEALDGDVADIEADLAQKGTLQSNAAQKVGLADNTGGLTEKQMQSPTLRALRNIKDPVVDPTQWTWSRKGRISQTTYSTGKVDRAEDGVSRASSNMGVTLTGGNASHGVVLQFDANNRATLGKGGDLLDGGINTLSASWEDKTNRLKLKAGRQTRQDAGVFGRYDGAQVQWGATDRLTLGMVAGSPAYTRDQLPFADERWFVGASVDYVFPGDRWDMQIYAIEQRSHGLVDRRALGGSLGYRDDVLSAIAGIDHDIYQNKVASAFGNANWKINEKLSASASIDYLTQPLLLTSNALADQDTTSIDDLFNTVGENRLKTLAADRTAHSISATLGLAYQLDEQWQLTADAYWSYVTGTPSSGGVEATKALGSEWLFSARASGQDILQDRDSLGLGASVRFAPSFTELSTDLSWMTPINEAVKLGGRLRVGTRFHDDDTTSFFAAPRLTGEYRLGKDWSLNGEAGAFIDSRDAGGDGVSIDVLALIGLHYEF